MPINGTCATASELYGPTDEPLGQERAHGAVLKAPAIEPEDIILSDEEQAFQRRLMVHAIPRILIENAGSDFGQHMQLPEASQPATEHLVDLQTSWTYPLPAIKIHESTVDGTIKVMEGLYATVGMTRPRNHLESRFSLWLVIQSLF
ncbi:hypothetical protein FRC08_004496 [Ceratobasidium sp. 394]|nr:hypothetical protein FRC08_004496 [Ceratobasidium sp. 394]KAG9101965.1 hypothetical protein FS749_001014 [Ceratobasidium sp. UAMH 11750]